MATGFQRVLEHLQQASGGLTDGQLLDRFLVTRDEASFATLVRRHGPMVLAVCRRILHDFHHAEDAFQATFLILARKAATVTRHESVSGWLYQVAYHTALEASAANDRRRGRERLMNDMPQREEAPAEAQDWRPLLDRELHHLPEKYRAAIVLCDLEGRTRKDAARLLKVPEGTLSSRLATGRQMLAKRLTRCGVALSGGVLAAALAQGTASAQIPVTWVSLTAKAALLMAAGQVAGLPTPAIVLMNGVMKTMLMKKLRLMVVTVMVLAVLGAAGFGYQTGDGSRAPHGDPVGRRLDIARQDVRLAAAALRAEDVTLESVPPVVVKTVPAAGADDVDPKLTEIKVTFSKDMEDGSWSWSTLSEESYPKVDGKPKYLADKRTCVLPVKLEAGKTYAVWVNSEKFGNFKDADGKSAVPYLLVFKTKK
jgi:RNA polymerase sigma factor (sigma-70 family)